MKTLNKQSFELYFDPRLKDEFDERIYEVNASLNEYDDMPSINYVYDLELAKYVDIDDWDHSLRIRFLNEVYEYLTRTGDGWADNDESDYYYEINGDR